MPGDKSMGQEELELYMYEAGRQVRASLESLWREVGGEGLAPSAKVYVGAMGKGGVSARLERVR